MARTARDTAVFLLDDETSPPPVAVPAAALDALARHLLAYRLHGRTAAAMVARLDGYLDRLDAIPLGEWCRWQDGAGRWLRLRHGVLSRPPPPHLWPWRATLATWVVAGYPLAVRAREAYLALDRGGRCAAKARWGPFVGPQGGADLSPLWCMGTPQAAIDALDRRAERLRVRTLEGLGH